MPDPYACLAREVLTQPQVMQQLTDWFDSDGPRSALQFGLALGEADADEDLGALLASWMAAGRCQAPVSGYLRGVANRLGSLPPAWTERLDQAAERHAEYAALLTLDADWSQAGFRRIMRLLDAGTLPPTYLRGFASSWWNAVLSVGDKAEVLRAILRRSEEGLQQLFGIGLALAANWTGYGREPLPSDLTDPTVRLLRDSLGGRIDVGDWSALLEALALTCPTEAADLAVEAFTFLGPARVMLQHVAMPTLVTLAGRYPQFVMEAIGRRLLDPERRPFFGLMRFPGLFETVGLSAVERWVAQHGTNAIKYIARHLDSPRLQDGQPFVPPVTEWLLTVFGPDDDVFRDFCSSRHALAMWKGHARERRAETEAAVRPFLSHRLRRVREWAQYELKENEYEAALDDHLDEAHERL